MSKIREDQYVKLENPGVVGCAPWSWVTWALKDRSAPGQGQDQGSRQGSLCCIASNCGLCFFFFFFFQVARPLLSPLRAPGVCLCLAGCN